MTLDLDELLEQWNPPRGEICARSITGRDGSQLIQLRVDLGVMQMFPDGRPDGERYRGLPTVLEYFQHEVRVARHDLPLEDWRALEREFSQLNYRRLAHTYLAEQVQKRDERGSAIQYLRRAVRDIELCVQILRVGVSSPEGRSERMGLLPTLVFNQARLMSQLRVLEGDFDDAIAQVERGADELDSALGETGIEGEAREKDAGVAYLRQMGQRLRHEHGITMTLRERLQAAIDGEDFELAAQLRDELRRRPQGEGPSPPTGPGRAE